MRCPFCRHQDTKVTDSRLVSEGEQIRRRRECLVCQERFTTYESQEAFLPRVMKRSGVREAFHLDKLRAGMTKALEKRPVPSDQIEQALDNVLKRLKTHGDREVASDVLGQWVLAALKEMDHIAYIRFASVYLRFEDVRAFRDEIDALLHPLEEDTHV